ncbi:hypothetical protein SCHPADRAFT_945100 [Schizopora paradoxa]|uniref:Uncharacterized protein n=1 Tax=Schizopora paradoxa TaxID=27342 RepID=A0A0H2R730_9AGAM|nr:hypothetical protein SCHPADRAFT_945100 [Schizopora paradoxa]
MDELGLNINATGVSSRGTSPRLWVAPPNFRGTMGIFTLCVSTLLICVWNAIHFDIPMHRFSTSRKFMVAISWTLLAVISPELILFIAFNQRLAATNVLKLARKTFSARRPARQGVIEGDDSSESIKEVANGAQDIIPVDEELNRTRKYSFTIVHGFYASMGGFVFDFLDENGKLDGPTFLPPGQTRMCISSSGVQFLLRHDPDLIPDISESSITDRSRGSSVGKGILIAQLAWFCANCISRLAQHLPLSLLEIATVAHGLCGMLTYALWWHKPLGLIDPTLIRGKRAREACALMAICSMKHQFLAGGITSIHLPAEVDFMTTVLSNEDASQTELRKLKPSSSASPVSDSTELEKQPKHTAEGYVSLVPEEQGLGELGLTPQRYVSPGVLQETSIALKAQFLYRIRKDDIPWHSRRRMPNEPVNLSPLDVNRWLMASNAMKRYGVNLKTLVDEIPSSQPYVLPKSTMQASSDTKARSPKGIAVTNAATVLLTVAFGLPHFLGWNVDFPSLTERTLWRIATVTVTSWGVGMCILAVMGISVRWWFDASPWDRRGEALFVACGSAVYSTAAGFLLIESVVQLFFLPPAAYNLPSWSNYWPHFG